MPNAFLDYNCPGREGSFITVENKSDKILAVSPGLSRGESEDLERQLSELSIERLELPVNLARRVGYVIGTLFLLIFLWSCFAPVNVVAKGQGQLQPYGRPKLIQTQLDGRVSEISVQEGQHVQKDQALLTLDAEVLKNQLDQAQLNLKKARISMEQLKSGKEALAKIIENPASLPVTVMDIADAADVVNLVYTRYKELQESKYDATVGGSGQTASELQDLKSMKTQLSSENAEKLRQIELLKLQAKNLEAQKLAEINNLNEQLQSHKEMLKDLQAVLNLSREQQKDYSDVLDLGVSRIQYLNISEKVAESARKVKDEKSAILDLEKQLNLAKLDLPRLRAESRSKLAELKAGSEQVQANIEDVNLKMRKTMRELGKEESEFQAALEKAKAALAKQEGDLELQANRVKELEDAVGIAGKNMENAVVRARSAGVVTSFSVRGAGEVVRSGQELMKLLPDHAEMVVAARIPNSDIGFVKVGQEAKIKLDAFPFQDFGVLKGQVQDIERYPEKDDTRGYSYKVWIRPGDNHITAMGKELPLKSGLTADCEIVVRKESVLRALAGPILKLGDISVRD